MRQRAVADIPESMLSDIRHHPPPRPPDGRLTRNKIKKPPLAVKKTGCSPEQKELLWETPPQPSPRDGTEKPPLFLFYRRSQASLSGVYEAFWQRCVMREKSKNRPREGLGTLPNGFLGDVLADM